MSEVNAAFGLLQLKHISEAMAERKKIDSRYRSELISLKGIKIPKLSTLSNSNHSYFPIIIQDGFSKSRDELYAHLKNHGVLSRRYFYPLISNMPMYRGIKSSAIQNLQVANYISDRVLCLPIFAGMTSEEQSLIIELLKD